MARASESESEGTPEIHRFCVCLITEAWEAESLEFGLWKVRFRQDKRRCQRSQRIQRHYTKNWIPLVASSNPTVAPLWCDLGHCSPTVVPGNKAAVNLSLTKKPRRELPSIIILSCLVSVQSQMPVSILCPIENLLTKSLENGRVWWYQGYQQDNPCCSCKEN